MNDIDIIIVDDHPLFREGVRNVINAEEDLNVVGEAVSGDQALDTIRRHNPQVALVDINLPVVNGIQVTRQIVSEKLPTVVVLLTAYDDVEQVLHAFNSLAARIFTVC